MRTGFSRWQQKVSDGVDRLMRAVSPKRAYLRQAYRFAYDALDGSRTRKPRSSPSGTGDVHLTESALSRLREICRDMGRNNPMVRGLLQHEADHVVGDEVKIEARSSDEQWNQAREQLWKEAMVDRPCEVTGRFNFAKSLNVGYYSYRRDGDFFCVFGEWFGPYVPSAPAIQRDLPKPHPAGDDFMDGVTLDFETTKGKESRNMGNSETEIINHQSEIVNL